MEHPLRLEGPRVKLIPMEREHFPELVAAGRNAEIWRYYHFNGADEEAMNIAHEEALDGYAKGQQYPFVVVDKLSGRVIGSTRFLQLSEEHRSLEIGSTWYMPEYWGTGYNEECKLALLIYCFDHLKCVRVAIAAWEKNHRSRKAIERIGATFEGVLRNNRIRNGEPRGTACYSIVPQEWEGVRVRLQTLIAERTGEQSTIPNSYY